MAGPNYFKGMTVADKIDALRVAAAQMMKKDYGTAFGWSAIADILMHMYAELGELSDMVAELQQYPPSEGKRDADA